MKHRINAFLLLSILTASSAWSVPADARVEEVVRYSKAQAYSAALRYLRVDLGYEVVERDPDAAYLLFEYEVPKSKRTTGGSIEIVSASDYRRLIIQLPKMPEYHERVLRAGLLEKLRTEYGEPPAPKPEPEPEPDQQEPEPEPPAEESSRVE